MSIDASLNGEFRAATGMFASHAGQWVEVPLGGGGGGTAEWVARSSVPAITSPAWVFPDVPAIPPGANLRWSVANDPDDGLPSLRIQHDGFTAASQAIWTGTALVDAALDATLTQDALNCRAKVRLNIVTGFLTEYSVGRPESASALHDSGGLMVTGYANLSPLAAGVSTRDTYFGQTPVAPVPEGGYGWTRLILGGNISNNVIPPLDAYLRLEWELLMLSDSGGGGGTPADPVWQEAAAIVGPPVRLEGATAPLITPPTVTLVGDLLTVTVPAQEGTPTGFLADRFAIPLPVLDMSDDTVVYRVTAETMSTNFPPSANINPLLDLFLSSDGTDYNMPVPEIEETSRATANDFPVGTVATLGTSVQQQRQNKGTPPESFDRQLARISAGAKPSIIVEASAWKQAGIATVAAEASFRLKMEKLVGAPAGEPLPGTIEWSEDLLTGFNDAAAWTVAPFSTNAPLDAYTISNVGTDVLIDVPAWVEPVAYSSKGNTFQRALAVPDLTDVVADGPVHLDLEFVYGAWDLPNTDPYVSIVNDEGDFINLTMPAATSATGGSVKPNLSADDLTSKLLAIFGGTNPRFTLAISGIAYSAGATLGPFNALAKSLTLRKQIGMGPEVEVPTAAPHVWSTDEPAGADRARFWIGPLAKYGEDRVTDPASWPFGGTPVSQPTFANTRVGTCTQSGGVLTLTGEAVTTDSTIGQEWITTWDAPPIQGLIPNPEEALSGTLRVSVTMTGYSSVGGYEQSGCTIYIFLDGAWKYFAGTYFSADGTVQGTLALNAADAAQILAGGPFELKITQVINFYFSSMNSFPAYTFTVQDMTAEFKATSPTIPRLYELVDDVYAPVDYPPV